MAHAASDQARRNKPAGQKEQAADVGRIKEDVEALANSVGSAAGHQYERAQDLAKDTFHRSENVVRRNPFGAILASASLGFLFALLRGGRK